MKKFEKIAIILLILCLMNITCFANYPDLQIQDDVEFVESLNLFADSHESYVTRRTMLYTFVNIADSTYAEYDFAQVDFADVEKRFKAMGFDRVYAPGVAIDNVLPDIKNDLGE